MGGKNTSVFGIFTDREAADEAVQHLRAGGFRNVDISALIPENPGTKDLAHERNTKAPEYGLTGCLAGGIAGGALGWVIGAGILAINGLSQFLVAGPWVAALAGAGSLGAVGGLLGALVGSRFPEYEAKRYAGRVREGGVLLSVHCDSREWVKRAMGILKMTGGEDIATASEKRGDFANADKPVLRMRSPSTLVVEAETAERPVLQHVHSQAVERDDL